MKRRIITVLYIVSSFIDDFAYFAIGNGEDESERIIKTPWGTHYY